MAKPAPSLNTLGKLIELNRGDQGIRAAAKEIGISPATLSRIENGKLPDLHNFQLICSWLRIDPNQILGFQQTSNQSEDTLNLTAAVHFKKKDAVSPQTAKSLGEMIMRAQAALAAMPDEY